MRLAASLFRSTSSSVLLQALLISSSDTRGSVNSELDFCIVIILLLYSSNGQTQEFLVTCMHTCKRSHTHTFLFYSFFFRFHPLPHHADDDVGDESSIVVDACFFVGLPAKLSSNCRMTAPAGSYPGGGNGLSSGTACIQNGHSIYIELLYVNINPRLPPKKKRTLSSDNLFCLLYSHIPLSLLFRR